MKKVLPTEKDLWFLPLGGSGEIGMNLNLYGHNKQWLMVDCGITFNDQFGIDVITPDIDFIARYRNHLVGLVLTHAHEDHIGAIPYIWPHLRCPIYGTKFTLSVLKDKISYYPWKDEVSLHEIDLDSSVKVGHFDVEYITLTHSIPEPNALFITTPLGNIMHTGDWKIDPAPVVGETTNEKRLKELGDKGVDVMVCDSTNVFSEGFSGSEEDVRKELINCFKKHNKTRLAIGCFASNVARVESIAYAANEVGRKVCLIGRSLDRMTGHAKSSGYMKNCPEFISDTEAMSLPRDKVAFIVTGSQGESRAALSRIASHQHPVAKLDEGDVVIFSSRIIPGNEKNISLLQNKLVLQGIKLVLPKGDDIHVSGHPSRGELKQMYEWVRPDLLIPVHGEFKHIYEQCRFGLECGINETIPAKNGRMVDISRENKTGKREMGVFTNGRLGVDGKRLIPINHNIIKERQKISSDGAIFVTIYNSNHVNSVELSFIGLCTEKEESRLRQRIEKTIAKTMKVKFANDKKYIESLKFNIRKAVKHTLDKKPLVQLHILSQN